MTTCPTCGRNFDAAHRYCPDDGAALVLGDEDRFIGATLQGQFHIVGVLGRGCTGTVYEAEQLGMDRRVAVKILHRELLVDEEMVRRFQREARAVAALSHPNIVTIYAAGTTYNGVPYLVMERVDGVPLEERLHGEPLTGARAIRYARQITAALAETHAEGLVHRDLKPANIMLARRRSGDMIKILDFGVAKVVDSALLRPGETKLTKDGAIFGTPHYLSPEQANGDPVDHRADIYAVGVLLYRMVTGSVPFSGNAVAVMLGHMNRTPEAPRSIDPDIDPGLEAIIMRCLEKSPARRFQSADALQRALESVGGGSIELSVRRRRSSTTGAPKLSTVAFDTEDDLALLRPRRRLGRWLMAALLLLGVAGGAAYAVDRGVDVPGLDYVAADLSSNIDAPAVATQPRPAAAAPDITRRAVVVGQGGYSMRVLLPARAMAGLEYEIVLDAWDPHGEGLATPELVVTLEGPDGIGHGVVARPAKKAGRYWFRRSFVRAGPYVLRVFPPNGSTAVNVYFDVLDPDAA